MGIVVGSVVNTFENVWTCACSKSLVSTFSTVDSNDVHLHSNFETRNEILMNRNWRSDESIPDPIQRPKTFVKLNMLIIYARAKYYSVPQTLLTKVSFFLCIRGLLESNKKIVDFSTDDSGFKAIGVDSTL